MSRIMFVPVCENCGHEFTELEFYIGPDTMIHMSSKHLGYVLKYSQKDYY